MSSRGTAARIAAPARASGPVAGAVSTSRGTLAGHPAPPVNAGLAALLADFADRHRLSQRERAVLSLGMQGVHRKGTAVCLGCSPGTVDTYWNRILRKLRLSSQLEVLASLLVIAVGAGPAARPPSRAYRRSRQDIRPAPV